MKCTAERERERERDAFLNGIKAKILSEHNYKNIH
jgi:hypothetical protein